MNAINYPENRGTEMNLNVIHPQPGGLGGTCAGPTSTVGAVLACMRNGMSAAREARRLYAMNDETLRQEGLTRAEIPVRLAGLL